MSEETQKVRIQLATGIIWAEVAPIGDSPLRRDVSAKEEDVLSIDIVRSAIEGLGQVVQEALAKVKPDKATVEFGLEVGVESGRLTALWVKGTGKADLKISLTWGK